MPGAAADETQETRREAGEDSVDSLTVAGRPPGGREPRLKWPQPPE